MFLLCSYYSPTNNIAKFYLFGISKIRYLCTCVFKVRKCAKVSFCVCVGVWERVCVCLCMCGCERESACLFVYLWVWERECVSVCVCVGVRERVCVCLCMCGCERESVCLFVDVNVTRMLNCAESGRFWFIFSSS